MASLATWTADIDNNQEIFTYDLAAKRATALSIANGVNFPCRIGVPVFTRSLAAAFLSRWTKRAKGPVDVRPLKRQVAAAYQQLRWRRSRRRHGRAIPCPLSVEGRAVPCIGLRLCAAKPIVYVHGGPTAQTMNSFNRNVQFLVNQGYVIIAPNYRGSTGYGKKFMDANRFDMGGGDLADCVAAADWIKQTGYVNPKKLVIMGASYGGYMTMMGLTKASDTWSAGVAIVPFVNWFTEIKNEDPLIREYDMSTMGDPDDPKNKQLFEERSPAYHADKIKAPLLMLAGGRDPRCPASETRQTEEAVKKRGGAVQVNIYENEGHSFSKIKNQIDAYTRVAAFLKLHVPAVRTHDDNRNRILDPRTN